MAVVDDWMREYWERKRRMCGIGRSQICGLFYKHSIIEDIDDPLVEMVFSSTSETSMT